MRFVSRILLICGAIVLVSACQPRKPEFEIASAVQQNDVEHLREYLAKGGNANGLSRFEDPLLFLASGRQGGIGVTKLLIDAGADVNVYGRNGITILSSAASWCNVEEIQLLIAAGADVNLRGKNKANPMESVCETPERRRNLTIKLLISAGAVPLNK